MRSPQRAKRFFSSLKRLGDVRTPCPLDTLGVICQRMLYAWNTSLFSRVHTVSSVGTCADQYKNWMHRNVNQLAVAELGFVFMSSAAESKHLPPGLRMCISFSCGSFYSPLHRPQLASILGPSQHKRHFPGEAFPEAVHIPQGCAALSPAMPPSRAACSQLQLCPYPHDDV